LARKARSLPRSQLRDHLNSPIAEGIDPKVSGVRSLANAVSDGAINLHFQGNDVEAIERIFDLLHLARAVRQDPFLVSQLVASGVDSINCQTIEIIAPGLFQPVQSSHAASREQVRKVIVQLLDEAELWQGLQKTLPMERLAITDAIDFYSKSSWVIAPVAEMEIVRSNRNFEIWIEAARLPNQPAMERRLQPASVEDPQFSPLPAVFAGPKRKTAHVRYSRWFLAFKNDLSLNFRIHFRTIAERRVAAVSLAAQLYRADRGHWPARLAELVPNYLPAFPQDPYFEDARPLGYVVQKTTAGADRPLVFFGAAKPASAPIAAHPMYGWQSDRGPGWTGLVLQYRDLSRFAPLPSAKTINRDPNQSYTPGN
jgi:hypothetical protein